MCDSVLGYVVIFGFNPQFVMNSIPLFSPENNIIVTVRAMFCYWYLRE